MEVNRMENKDTTPDLNVKAGDQYVGSAWVNVNKYGKYVNVILNEDVPKGTKLFLSPRKGREGVLGG